MNFLKHLFKIVLYALFVFVLFIYFAPKKQLYYLGETFLEKHDVIINAERVEERRFSLVLHDGEILYHGVRVGRFEEISLMSFLFWSDIEVKQIDASKQYKELFPASLENGHVYHTLWRLFYVYATGAGEAGEIDARLDIRAHHVVVKLTPSLKMTKKYPHVLQQMKKQKGRYVYGYAY